jgi:hypothetical protein
MLTAYFDDSNTSPNQKAAVVAGYLGSTSQWDRFCRDWAKLIQRYGISNEEADKVRRSALQNRKDIFTAWDKTRCDNFVKDAYSVINKFTYIPIGAAVSTRDFEEIATKEDKQIFGSVYGWCANACAHDVMVWCERHNYQDKINYVFEDGTYGRGQVREWFIARSRTKPSRDRHRLGSITFAGKDVKPLQAADFVAYDLGRLALDITLNRTRDDVVQIFHNYILGKKQEAELGIRYWDRAMLKSFFANWPPKEDT